MIFESIIEAFELLITFDYEIYSIIFLSLLISCLATITAGFLGVISGILISISQFKGKRLLKKIMYTFMGIPPVVLGLFVLLFLSGPLANMNLLFTQSAMYIAQTLLVYPIITGTIIMTSEKTQLRILETATTLGAQKKDKLLLLLHEMRPYIIFSLVLGFSRAISEVGAVMLVGGNIRGETRVMTTYIALNTSMGNYSASIAMGLILLFIAFLFHSFIARFRGDLYD
ncbi:MAG: ABC transporter permease [Bacillota bacterium]